MNSFNTKEHAKNSIILLAHEAKIQMNQNKHLLEIIDIFKQQISMVKNLITNYSLHSNLNVNNSINLALIYKNELLSLKSKLKEDIDKNIKKQEINYNNISHDLSMINQVLSQLSIDNFILNNTINKYDSQLKNINENLEGSKKYDAYREPIRETEIELKESKNVFLIHNLECQQKMLSYCRAYTKYKYKNLKKRTKLNRIKNHLSILKNIIKYYSLELYGDETKLLKEFNEIYKKENKNKNLVDIKKRVDTTPEGKNYKFSENIKYCSINENNLNEDDNKDTSFNKSSLFKEEDLSLFQNIYTNTEKKNKETENNSERKKINILKIDELLDVENIEVENEEFIEEELNSDDEVFFEKKVKPKKKINTDFLSEVHTKIPLINLSQIEFNKLKVINEADAYSLQKRKFEQNNINGKIKNLKKQIKILEKHICRNKKKLNVIHNFIEDVKYNYKLLRPIKVQTSAAGNTTNYIREKLLNIVEETIQETEKKDNKIYSDNKNKTGKTEAEEGEEELVGSDYSDEDEYIGNDENKEYNFENKENSNIDDNQDIIINYIEKDKKIFYKNKLKNSKIKTNLISKFVSDEKEKDEKDLNNKIIYNNFDINGSTYPQSK